MTFDDYTPALAEAITTLPQPVLMVDAKSRIHYVNYSAIKLFGRERDDIEGLLIDELLPEQFPEGQRSWMEQFVLSGRSTGDGHPAEGSLSRLVMPGAQPMAIAILTNVSPHILTESLRLKPAEPTGPETLAAINLIDDNVVVLDREWRFLFANDAMLKLNHIEKSDLIGKRFTEIYPAFIGTPVDQSLQRAFDPPPTRVNHELLDPRSGRWYQVEIIPSASTLILHTTDITETKQTRALYEQLMLSLDSLNDPIMMMDRQWQYSFVNLAGAGFIGRNRAELLGKNIWDLSPWLRDTPFGRACLTAMESTTPFMIEDYYQPRDRWLNVNFYPRSEGFTVYIADTTELKQNRQQLAKVLSETDSESKIHAVFDLMSSPLLILDGGLRYTYANAAAMKVNNRTAEEMIGAKMGELNPALIDTPLVEGCRAALESGERQQFEMQLPPSGAWLSVDAIPWNEHVILSAVDISKLKDSQESIEILTSTLEQAMDQSWNRPDGRDRSGPSSSPHKRK